LTVAFFSGCGPKAGGHIFVNINKQDQGQHIDWRLQTPPAGAMTGGLRAMAPGDDQAIMVYITCGLISLGFLI